MAKKPIDSTGPAYVAARRGKVVKTARATPAKKAAMPARSNKGGATRGQARAAQVQSARKSAPAKPRVTPEVKQVYMTMNGVPKHGGLPVSSMQGPMRAKGPTPGPMLPSQAPTVTSSTLGKYARNKPPSQVKRPQ